MAAAAAAIANKRICEARRQKQRQKNDSAEFIRGVLERHDKNLSGLSLRHADALCWLVPCRYLAAYLI